jgi:hypothetical protein
MKSMTGPVVDATAMNVIVAVALLFAVGFLAAWAMSPWLRAWIEKPSHQFQKNARAYDERLSERNRL